MSYQDNKDTGGFLQRFKARLLSLFSPMKLLLLGVVVAGVLAIIFIPQWQARDMSNPKDHAIIENAARLTLVQSLGGLFFIFTAYLSFQNLKVTQQNLIATQEKQVTERFAKAIEQLGNASIHVRLGAIYALERISKDSDKDYWQVMEILTAYVRETSPYPPREQKDKADNMPLWASALSIHQKNNHPTATDSQKDISSFTTDIQAVLTVISRRAKSCQQDAENRLDLSKSNLCGADLKEANLVAVNLTGANLVAAYLGKAKLGGAYLMGADLQEAYLMEANLKGAYLMEACLVRANLEEAHLGGANLEDANLEEAHLVRANLEEAHLVRANLMEANLEEANLKGANLVRAYLVSAYMQETYLREANLRGVDLVTANLEGADLVGANLEKANLVGTNLEKANLEGANLEGANLEGANLEGANLKSANLFGTNLSNAHLQKAQYTDKSTSQKTCKEIYKDYPCPTTFPLDFDPKAAGMVLKK